MGEKEKVIIYKWCVSILKKVKKINFIFIYIYAYICACIYIYKGGRRKLIYINFIVRNNKKIIKLLSNSFGEKGVDKFLKILLWI